MEEQFVYYIDQPPLHEQHQGPGNDVWIDMQDHHSIDAKDSVHVELCVTPPLEGAGVSEQPELFLVTNSEGVTIVTSNPGMVHTTQSHSSVIMSQAVISPHPPKPIDSHQSLMSSTQLISSDTSTTFGSDLLQDPDQSKSSLTREQTVLSPSQQSKSKKQNVVKKIIVIQPHEDPEKATADAIEKITQNLDREAAESVAAGKTPQKETVIEIMRIRAPSATPETVATVEEKTDTVLVEGNMANNSLPMVPSPKFIVQVQPHCGTPEERKHHRRKHVPTRYMYRTPSPPPGKVSRPASTSGHSFSDKCYFQPKPRCSSVVGTASTLLLGNRGTTPTPNILPLSNSIPCSQQGTFTSRPPSNTRLPAILRNSRQPSFEAAPPPSIGTTALQLLTQSGVVRPKPIPASKLVASSSSDSDTSQEIKESAVRPNDSLTNIHWLGSMSGEKLARDRDLRIIATERQIEKISRECGRKKRPPYSYMHLIQMAIYSKPDKRMTLREIYKWIEEKFAYYKYSPNQGWKNSIRHNLSLYKIFVREKRDSPGKTSLSYWTLRSDVSDKLTKCMKPLLDGSDGSASDTNSEAAPSPNPMTMSNIMRSKKGPVPLLPKPPCVQTYALVPLQSGVPMMPAQPLMWSSVPASNGRVLTPIPPPVGSDMTTIQPQISILPNLDCAKSNVKRIRSPTLTTTGPKNKQVKLASKALLSDDTSQESWLRTDTPTELRTHTPSDSELTSSMDTSSLRQQLSQMHFIDSGIDLRLSDSSIQDMTSSFYNTSSSIQKGLPIPKMYTLRGRKGKGKGKTSEQSLKDEDRATPSSSSGSEYGSGVKKEVHLSLDSSVSEPALHDILSSIEKSLSSPMRSLLQTPMKTIDQSMLTSTPFKEVLGSPSQWLSPIKGLTPINSDGMPQSSLFTPPSEGKGKSSAFQVVTPKDKDPFRICGPDISPKPGPSRGFSLLNLTPLKTPFKTPPKTHSSDSNEQSPNESFGILGNHSFAKLLGDIHLESMIDEGINLDVSNMSFSALQ